jgi:FtsH-binding integral membrane protein
MFHRNEIEDGEGRSRRDEFIIFVSGISLIFCVFIRKMMTAFDLGCGLVLLSLLTLLLRYLLGLVL